MAAIGVKLGRVFENTSKKSGRKYFSGKLGAARILIMKNDKAETDNEWTIFVQDPPDEKQTSQSFSNDHEASR